MPAPFPHRYAVDLARTGETTAVLEAPPRRPLVGGPPPEFDGGVDAWSPEHLLLSSVALCEMTTFLAVAKRSGLAVETYASHAEGVLDKTASGLRFTSIVVHVDVAVAAEDAEKARTLLEKAKKHCIVSNSLAVPVTLDARVVTGALHPRAVVDVGEDV